MNTSILAFYKFVTIDDPTALRTLLLGLMHENGLRGKIVLADEGINGTVAGPPAGIDAFLDWFGRDGRFTGMRTNRDDADRIPFRRALVKVKPEIVTMRVGDIDAANGAGTYVKPEEWNAMISDPDTIIVDTRNDFEVEMGSFPNAIDPRIVNFNDFPKFAEEKLSEHKDRRIAMYCTGGIRCEKATAYLRARGFKKVYHLEGGILGYLRAIDEKDSKWQGECFVFDQRVSVPGEKA